MKVVVPTLNVRCTLREPCAVAGKDFKPGAVVTLPYGIALQGLARGVVGAIVDAEAMHAKAIELLQVYGGDAWFPAAFQTVGRLMAAYAAAEADSKTAIIH